MKLNLSACWIISFGVFFSVLLTPTYVLAANQAQIGTGNQTAIQLSQNSPLIQSAFTNLNNQASQIRDRALRTAYTSKYTVNTTEINCQ